MTNILIQQGHGANNYSRMSFCRAFQAAGFNCHYWNPEGKSPFDIFDEYKPTHFIGGLYQVDRALFKCLTRNNIKVILHADNWGDLDIDLQKFPVGITTDEQKRLAEELRKNNPGFTHVYTQHNPSSLEKTHSRWREISVEPLSVMMGADIFEYFPTEENSKYNTDITYCGNSWKYKNESSLDKYLRKILYPNTNWIIKVFGDGGWDGVNYLGRIGSHELNQFYRNAKVVPSFSEAHSVHCYGDIPQRYFQVPSSFGFQLAEKVIGLEDIFDEDEVVTFSNEEEFFSKLTHYLNNPDETIPYRQKSMKTVMSAHTTIHRTNILARAFELDCTRFIEMANEIYQRWCA